MECLRYRGHRGADHDARDAHDTYVVDSWCVRGAPSPVPTSFAASCTMDEEYMYIHTLSHIFKVGTGLGISKCGKVVASRALATCGEDADNTHSTATTGASAKTPAHSHAHTTSPHQQAQHVWIGYVAGVLFRRCSTDTPGLLTVVDPKTLEDATVVTQVRRLCPLI